MQLTTIKKYTQASEQIQDSFEKKNACKSNRIQWKKRQNFLLKTTNLIKYFNYIIQFNLQ